jgi:sodium/pantothenate symporter
MFGMHLAGALGRAVMPGSDGPGSGYSNPDGACSPFAAGIFLAAPMAAIMSTINAQLQGFRYDH